MTVTITPAATGSGAPALGEPLAVEYGNTWHAVRGTRGGLHDALATPETLAAWLVEHGGRFPEGVADAALAGLRAEDLPRWTALRDAIRTVEQAVVTGTAPDADALATVNTAAAAAPRVPRLVLDADGRLTAVEVADPHPHAALAALAASAIDVFGGPQAAALRACEGPGCVLFYVRNHPRRGWCSPGCGNRARVARYHERHKG
ncbi:CGNR zinc finger domain-containing protein [Yinghuangia seranimata]|uniref:CGNR zinc finger domain-containing protein n=1 Tax=Yinghuangia seranimata TaxID=408067 RepID=UPI00248CFFB0|nr:CGNR zinc finger domain-containing protein [Yinghuangia seranimata]MDI2127308.1 CGNR zinc finger domain-containing protein [Yinghuangia seranimata]